MIEELWEVASRAGASVDVDRLAVDRCDVAISGSDERPWIMVSLKQDSATARVLIGRFSFDAVDVAALPAVMESVFARGYELRRSGLFRSRATFRLQVRGKYLRVNDRFESPETWELNALH